LTVSSAADSLHFRFSTGFHRSDAAPVLKSKQLGRYWVFVTARKLRALRELSKRNIEFPTEWHSSKESETLEEEQSGLKS
jgi:hypothetical protein